MKSIAACSLFVLAALAVGCMGASESTGVGRRDAGAAYSGGGGGTASGLGGNTGPKADAGAFPASDAKAGQASTFGPVLPPNPDAMPPAPPL